MIINSVAAGAPLVLAAIHRARRILLHLHLNPDPDSVGGALAMYHALKSLGKVATVIKGDSPMPNFLSHLPGFEVIVAKNFFELDLKQFDLFIIQDSSSLDRISRQAPVIFPSELATVVIDHHSSNLGYGQLNLIAPEYPANCELLYDLFIAWGVALSADIAANLFLGIYADTGGFRHTSTRRQTFEVAAKLVALLPNFPELISRMENQNAPETIRFEALALQTIVTACHGRVAMAEVSQAMLSQHGIRPEHYQGVSLGNIMKSVIGWEVVVVLIEEEPGEVKVSFRTRESKRYDLSRVAATLGGGGHPAAAGALLAYPLPEAKRRVLEALQVVYPTLES